MGFGKHNGNSLEDCRVLIEISSSEDPDSEEEDWETLSNQSSERELGQSFASQIIYAEKLAEDMATLKRLSYDIDTLMSVSNAGKAFCNVSKFSADAWKENILKHIPKPKDLMEETEGIDPKLPQLPRPDRILFPSLNRPAAQPASIPNNDPKFAEFKKRVASPPSKFVTPGGNVVPVDSSGSENPSADNHQGGSHYDQLNVSQPVMQGNFYPQMVIPHVVAPQVVPQPVMAPHMIAPHIMSPMVSPMLNIPAMPPQMSANQPLPSAVMAPGHAQSHPSNAVQATPVQYYPGGPVVHPGAQPIFVVNGPQQVPNMPAVGMPTVCGPFVQPIGQMPVNSSMAHPSEGHPLQVLPVVNNVVPKPDLSERQLRSAFEEQLKHVTGLLKGIDKHIARFRDSLNDEEYHHLVEQRRFLINQRDEYRRSLEEMNYLKLFIYEGSVGIPRGPTFDERKEPWALKSETDPRLYQSMLEQIRDFGTPVLRAWVDRKPEFDPEPNAVLKAQTEEEMEETCRQARIDSWAFDIPEAWELSVRSRWVFGRTPAPNRDREEKYNKIGICLPDGIIEYLLMKELIARCPRNDGVPLLPMSSVSQWVDSNGVPLWKIEAAAPTDALGNKILPPIIKFWQEGRNKPLSVFDTWARGMNPLYWRPLTRSFSQVRAACLEVVKIVNSRHLHFSAYGEVIWGGFHNDPHAHKHKSDPTYRNQFAYEFGAFTEEEVNRYQLKQAKLERELKRKEMAKYNVQPAGRTRHWISGLNPPVKFGTVFLAELLKDPRYSSGLPKPSIKEKTCPNKKDPVTVNGTTLSNPKEDKTTKENKNPLSKNKLGKMPDRSQHFPKAGSSVSGPSTQAVAKFPNYDGAADSLSQKTSSSTTEQAATNTTTAGPSSSATSAVATSEIRSEGSSSSDMTGLDAIRPKDVTLNRNHHNKVEQFFKTLRDEERDEIAKYKANHPVKR